MVSKVLLEEGKGKGEESTEGKKGRLHIFIQTVEKEYKVGREVAGKVERRLVPHSAAKVTC